MHGSFCIYKNYDVFKCSFRRKKKKHPGLESDSTAAFLELSGWLSHILVYQKTGSHSHRCFCAFFTPALSPQGPKLLYKYQVKSFLMPRRSLETPVDPHLYYSVKTGLVKLLGARSYFASTVLTPYCYTLGNSFLLNVSPFV